MEVVGDLSAVAALPLFRPLACGVVAAEEAVLALEAILGLSI